MAGSNKVLYIVGAVVLLGGLGLGTAWMLGAFGSKSSTTTLGKADVEKMWEEYIKTKTTDSERLTKDQFKYLAASLYALTKLDRKTFDTFYSSGVEDKKDEDKKKADNAHKKGEEFKKKWFTDDNTEKEIAGQGGFFSEFLVQNNKLLVNNDQEQWLDTNKDRVEILYKEDFTKTFEEFKDVVIKKDLGSESSSDTKYSLLDLAAARWFSLIQ